MEIDEQLLQEIKDQGGTIKGREEDEAVLCTRTQTFALKHVQTTNTMLLITPSQDLSISDVITVAARSEHHLEAVLAAPRLEGLSQLLPEYQEESTCSVASAMEEDTTVGIDDTFCHNGATESASAGRLQASTTDQLLDRLQASRAEVERALKQVGAVQLDGTWFRLAPDLAAHLLRLLLLSCATNGWLHTAVPGADAAAALCDDEVDSRLASHCLALFGHPSKPELRSPGAEPPIEAPSAHTWVLENDKVAVHFAKQLLFEQQGWQLAHFMTAWREALDQVKAEDVLISEDLLKGEALLDRSTQMLRRFPEVELPMMPTERFNALWAAQSRWSAQDIEPYVAGLQVPGQDAKALLLRYARKSQIGQEVFYNCRK